MRKSNHLTIDQGETVPHYALEMASATDKGAVRAFNEDSIATDMQRGVAILADGMGGHKAGDVASAMATDMLMEELHDKLEKIAQGNSTEAEGTGHSKQSYAVKTAVSRANLAIYHAAQRNLGYQGMGTTLALAVFYDDKATLAHVGDSRIYRLRSGKLELLTRDHSLLREQVAHGMIDAEDARVSHNRALVTRALGVTETVELTLEEKDVLPGDVYLLCSDGLNDMVEDRDIELIVDGLNANLTLAARHLVDAANDLGGQDNISVILVKVLEQAPQAEEAGLIGRLFGWFK
jgi:protein phosphatase